MGYIPGIEDWKQIAEQCYTMRSRCIRTCFMKYMETSGRASEYRTCRH